MLLEFLLKRVDIPQDARKIIEKHIKKDSMLDLLFSNITSLLFITNLSGDIISYYGPKEDLYRQPEDFLGKNIKDVLPLDVVDTILETIKRANNDNYSENEYFLDIKGEKKYFEIKTKKINVNSEILFIHTINDITERKKIESKFRIVFDNALDGILIADSETKNFILANKAICHMLGFSQQEILHLSVSDIHPGDKLPFILEQFKKQVCGEIMLAENIPLLKKNGKVVFADINSVPIELEKRKCLLGIFRDVTERVKLEEEKKVYQEEKLQNEKMRVIGQLAGGIAHDFNNILTAIIGNVDLILRDYKDNPYIDELKEIMESAKRAAALTSQLLAFSRKQPICPKYIDINEIISHSLKMINRLIGENIRLIFIAGKNLKLIYFDPSQLEQIFINLAVNARDAMPYGGELIINTETKIIQSQLAKYEFVIVPGEYVVLEVIDNGKGIAKENLDRIFEPFFTTKGLAQGTGLGLSIVYGIVKQNNGLIQVDSELGKGTKFSIYFPVAGENYINFEEKQSVIEDMQGSGSILVVEDEEYILKLIEKLLSKRGYEVISSWNVEKALDIAKKFFDEQKNIDLLISDVIMPLMSGKELYYNIKNIFPKIKVLFISGYTYEIIKTQGVDAEGINFLQKPFVPNELYLKVKNILLNK